MGEDDPLNRERAIVTEEQSKEVLVKAKSGSKDWLRGLEVGGIWLAAIVALISIWITHRDISSQIKSLQDQLTLDHPAKLRISHVEIWESGKRRDDVVVLRPTAEISGRFPLVNVGKDYADVVRMFCEVKWVVGELPMYRSFWEGTPQTKCGDFGRLPTPDEFKPEIKPRFGTVTGLVMRPGFGAMWEFKTIVPNNYTPQMRLLVWGTVQYRDRVSEHSYVFARFYDPNLGRFRAEADPDFEGQESDERR
uniref:Uncharacterized protein n=2 Tax=Rhodopseudomonas palustris TaxID=1076 RepID=E6VER2_RHOPX